MKRYIKFIILLILVTYGIYVNTYLRDVSFHSENTFIKIVSDIGNNIIFIPSISIINDLFFKKILVGKLYDNFLHFSILSMIEVLSIKFKILGVFDYKDVLGLFIGLIFSIFLYYVFEKK